MDNIAAYDPHGDPVRVTAHRPAVGQVVLLDPTNKALTWGPEKDFQFGPKGGFEEHYAVVDADHPMLNQLLTDQPQIKVLEDSPVAVYVCSDCGKDFKSRPAIAAHQGQAHGRRASAGVQAIRTGPLQNPEEPYPQDDPVLAEQLAMQRELNENIKWLRAQQDEANAKASLAAKQARTAGRVLKEAAPVSLTEQPQPAPVAEAAEVTAEE